MTTMLNSIITWDINDFDVTDDKYDTDTKEIRIILYRYVIFYIICNSIKEWSNILVIKFTLFYTKDEDKKSRT